MALVLVGLLLLAFQLFGREVGFGGTGSITLVDQDYQGNRIELSAAASDVEIRPGSGSRIHVEAIQRGGSQGDYKVDVVPSGDTVRVTETSSNFFWFFGSRSVRYRITVPSDAQADIHTASGEIDVEGLSGAVSLASVSGDVRAGDLTGGLTVGTTSGEVQLNDIAGKLDVESISGDVKLENGKIDGATVSTTSGEVQLDGVAGALKLTSVSGDIHVREARDGRLDLSTTSGEIEYEGSLASTSANTLNSISGDVNLRLPEESGFRLDASTVSGDLSSEFELRDGADGAPQPQRCRRRWLGHADDWHHQRRYRASSDNSRDRVTGDRMTATYQASCHPVTLSSVTVPPESAHHPPSRQGC